MMRKTICLCLILMLGYIPFAYAESPAGRWITVDDKTGKKRAEIELKVLPSGQMVGYIDRTYPQPGDTGMCDACPGQFKDKPIKGLRFIWGLVDKGHGTWEDGHILDAKSGTIYRLKMTQKGDKLFVRGYIGFSLIGRTQVWTRFS